MFKRGYRWGPGWKAPALIKIWTGAQSVGQVGGLDWTDILEVELMELSDDKNGG